MSVDLSSLDRLKTGGKRKSKRKEWRPLELAMLDSDSVLAFDQTLGATGWLDFTVAGDAALVHVSGKFGTESEATGHEGTLDRGVEAWQRFGEILDAVAPVQVAYEAPPVGGRIRAPESSQMAALALRIACQERQIPTHIVYPRSAKWLICGNASADKKEAHAALAEFAERVGISSYRAWITNEAKRDAMLVALYHLSRQEYR